MQATQIGPNKELVRKRIKAFTEPMKNIVGVPKIVGLVGSVLHDSYEVVDLPETESPLLLACDLVAKSIVCNKDGIPYLVPVRCRI